jgi:hypothetical protein
MKDAPLKGYAWRFIDTRPILEGCEAPTAGPVAHGVGFPMPHIHSLASYEPSPRLASSHGSTLLLSRVSHGQILHLSVVALPLVPYSGGGPLTQLPAIAHNTALDP